MSVNETIDIRERFADFCHDHGLRFDGLPVMDGKSYRCRVDGDEKGKQSGAYIGYADFPANGRVTNFRQAGKAERWRFCGEQSRLVSNHELERRIEVSKARKQEQLDREHKENLAVARDNYKKVMLGNDGRIKHEYLERKGVKLASNFIGQCPFGNKLMVPVFGKGGLLQTFQSISADGQKRFTSGLPLGGGFTIFCPDGKTDQHNNPDPTPVLCVPGELNKIASNTLIISEGLATGLTVARLTNQPVCCVYSAHNYKPAIDNIKKLYPGLRIMIAPDNDQKKARENGKNVGLESGIAAAKDHGAQVLIPRFSTEEQEKGCTDWNDLMLARGKVAAQNAMGAAMRSGFVPKARVKGASQCR